MNLLIHDLNEKQWEDIRKDYENCTVISDQGNIRPCIGCFSCWNREPGKCIFQDGYENMGSLIHHADEVIVISRYTYGGFSSFIKNLFDRSLGYVLPHFEIVNGESHHQRRYDECKPYTFIFYGNDLSDEEKQAARRYVTAVTANMRTQVRDVIFRECEEDPKPSLTPSDDRNEKIILLNASMRYQKGNSAKLALQLKDRISREAQIINLAQYLNNMEDLLNTLEEDTDLVLCMPLYVDGLPSQLIRLMELMQRKYTGKKKDIYVLANMGLYESRQLINLFEASKQWSDRMGFTYCGGLGTGAGELVGGVMEMLPFGKWPTSKISQGMDRLAEAIDEHSQIEDIYTEVHRFPRSLYVAIANSGWKRMAKRNGITEKDLFRQL